MVPNLVVIGAAKCGTTSLHAYLGLHPEISMSRVKEVGFFLPSVSLRSSIDWYERQFPSGTPVRGEATPGYTFYPENLGVPERMCSVVPEARLIYLVRDPVTRTLRGYAHERADGRERQTLEQALGDVEQSQHVQTSRYGFQLEQFLPHFDRSQILVVAQEELLRARAETLRRVFRFLGVDESFESPHFAAVKHEGSAKRPKRRAAHFVERSASRVLGRPLAQHIAWSAPRALVRPLTRAPEPPPVVDDALRRKLEDYLRPDAERLRALTGLELSDWSV